MTIFDYVMVLASIIIGLAVTHLLQGLARIVYQSGRSEIYWVHVLWVVSLLEIAIFWWWWEFAFSSTHVWTFGLYLFVLGFAAVIYFLAALLIPGSLEGYAGYKDYYYTRRFWLLGLYILFCLLDAVDTALKGADYFASLGWQYPVTGGVQIALCVAGMMWRKEWLHAAIPIVALLINTQAAIPNVHAAS
jgi:hypothetical protein